MSCHQVIIDTSPSQPVRDCNEGVPPVVEMSGSSPRTSSRPAGLVSSPWLSYRGLRGLRESPHPAMASQSVVLGSGCGRDSLLADEPGAEEPPTAQPADEGLAMPGRSRRSPARDFARVGAEVPGAGRREAAV